MSNVINLKDERIARMTLEEKNDVYMTDVMVWVNDLIENPTDLVIVNTNILRQDEEIPEEAIEFIDSEMDNYEDYLWTRFVENNKTIFNASFANNYSNSWMSLIYGHTGENVIIEKVS